MVDALGLDYAKFTIVKSGTKAWAFKDVDGDDRYEDNGVAGSKLSSLVETTEDGVVLTNDIEIRLQGGSFVYNLASANTKIKNVVAESGVNTIDDVIVTGNITVNSGATLNINNTVVTLAKTYFYSGNIVNNGTLNTNNVSLNVAGSITNKGSMNVTNGDLWYGNRITQDGTQSGKVQPGLVEALSKAANVTVSSVSV